EEPPLRGDAGAGKPRPGREAGPRPGAPARGSVHGPEHDRGGAPDEPVPADRQSGDRGVGPGAGARAPAPGSRRAVRGGPGAEGSLLMTALIETRLEDHVWTIVLNRPEKRNALTVEMIGAFHDAVHEAAGRRDVRVVVVAAAGPTFCAGLDLRE